jgi:hypothetical protein
LSVLLDCLCRPTLSVSLDCLSTSIVCVAGLPIFDCLLGFL